MKNLKYFLPLLLFFLTSLSSYSKVGVGVKNNRYIYGELMFKDHYALGLNVSVFSEKIGFQYAKAYFGYRNSIIKNLDYTVSGEFGSALNGSYYSGGAKAGITYTAFKRLFIDAVINPHYDSGYGYKTCFSAGPGVIITNEIDFFVKYTTIPEYRMSEERLHIGFDFKVKKLSVTPILSVGTSAQNGGGKNFRILMSFNYIF